MANEQIKRQIVKSIINEMLDEDDDIPASVTPVSGPTKLPLDEIIQKIKDTKGAFFTVKFIKKDGTERVMNCRLGVKKYLHGGELPYDPVSKGLLPVWDPVAAKTSDGYRIINTKTILLAKINGVEYVPQEITEDRRGKKPSGERIEGQPVFKITYPDGETWYSLGATNFKSAESFLKNKITAAMAKSVSTVGRKWADLIVKAVEDKKRDQLKVDVVGTYDSREEAEKARLEKISSDVNSINSKTAYTGGRKTPSKRILLKVPREYLIFIHDKNKPGEHSYAYIEKNFADEHKLPRDNKQSTATMRGITFVKVPTNNYDFLPVL